MPITLTNILPQGANALQISEATINIVDSTIESIVFGMGLAYNSGTYFAGNLNVQIQPSHQNLINLSLGMDGLSQQTGFSAEVASAILVPGVSGVSNVPLSKIFLNRYETRYLPSLPIGFRTEKTSAVIDMGFTVGGFADQVFPVNTVHLGTSIISAVINATGVLGNTMVGDLLSWILSAARRF